MSCGSGGGDQPRVISQNLVAPQWGFVVRKICMYVPRSSCDEDIASFQRIRHYESFKFEAIRREKIRWPRDIGNAVYCTS